MYDPCRYNTYCTCNPVRLQSVESTQHVSWNKCSLARSQWSPKKQLIILVYCPVLPYIVSMCTVQLALAVKKSVNCTWNVLEITGQWDSKNRRKGIRYLSNLMCIWLKIGFMSTEQLALAVKKSVYCTWNVLEITVQWDSKNRRKGIRYLSYLMCIWLKIKQIFVSQT